MSENRVQIPEAFSELFQPARYKAYFGGRGSGKSQSFARALLIQGAQEPLRVLCCREVQKSIKDSVKQLLDDMIEAMGLSGEYQSLQAEIRGKNGTKFIFTGLQEHSTESIKSYEGINVCWVEEAQTVSDRSLELLIPTIRAPGSELWFTWNPRNASDPVDKRFRGLSVPENSIIRRVNYDDNPFFPAELDAEREFDRKTKPDRYAHIWLGEYEPMAIGAIWNRVLIHETRRNEPPELERVLVSVDPATSSEEQADEHGIIVVGMGSDGRGYLLEDGTTRGSPRKWAERAVTLYDKWGADAIVYERNQGGDMVKYTLSTIRSDLPCIDVWASKGKHVRAEPIAALYHGGKVSHVGTFPELEDQMCKMTAAGFEGEGSPDRCDAMVWGFTELFPGIVEKKDRELPAREGFNPLMRQAGGNAWMAR